MPSCDKIFAIKCVIVGAGWIGWMFSLCAVISMDWINGGEALGTHHSGLFMQSTPCEGTTTIATSGWLGATIAFMILGVITGLAGCIADAVGSAMYNDGDDQTILLKQIAGGLLSFAAVCVMIGASIFTANGRFLQSSELLNITFGPGFALAWTSFVFMGVGSIVAFVFPCIVA